MSVSLSYDPDLSRVLIVGGGLGSNAGFETSIAEWSAIGGTLDRSTVFAHSGDYSALLTPDGVTGVPIAQTTQGDSPAAVAGTQYTLTGWYYSPAGWAQVSLAITWLNASNTVLTTAATTTTAIPAGVWTQFTLTATAPANTAKAQLRARMHGTPAAADVLYVDDMVLLPTLAVTADVEKSTNEITWQPVRGGIGYDLSTPVELSDYEFTNAAPTFYRIILRNAAGTSLDVSAVASIAPEITRVWLKSIIRPFLNQPVFTTDNISGAGRAARNGVHHPLGRNRPVVVTDVRQAKEVTIEVHCETDEERDALDYLLDTGDLLFVHTPTDFPLRSFYAAVGDTDELRQGFPASRIFTLPLIQCAAPGPDIVGSTTTWEDVVANYATWEDVVADKPTWEALVRRIADPDTVVVE